MRARARVYIYSAKVELQLKEDKQIRYTLFSDEEARRNNEQVYPVSSLLGNFETGLGK
jgi:hypothetical protein